MKIILGINAYHADSSACCLIDGEVVAAVEEERFSRVKHWCGFPEQSIRYVLQHADIDINDVDYIAVNSDNNASMLHKVRYLMRRRVSASLLKTRLQNRRQRQSVSDALRAMNNGERIKAKIVPVEHHLSHGAACWYTSPFQYASVVSVDGFGDFSSAMIATGRRGGLTVSQRIQFPHSLGVFYQAMTQYLGFNQYGDEYKVMGLAAYGKPVFLNSMNDVVQTRSDGRFALNMRYFVHGKQDIFSIGADGEPVFSELYSAELVRLFGVPRNRDDVVSDKHWNLASSTQQRYEDCLFNLLRQAHKESLTDNLCLSGGCAMNSVANGKIIRETPFNDVYIQPAAGDSGGALGAALWVEHNVVSQPKIAVLPGLAGNARRVSMRTRRAAMLHAPQLAEVASDAGKTMFFEGNKIQYSESTSEPAAKVFDPYIGPAYPNSDIKDATQVAMTSCDSLELSTQTFNDDDRLTFWVAEQLSRGAIVAWYQGRLEWGARALGNRSILADPRRADMRNILNSKIKQREDFRPFAPSVLAESMEDWFDVQSPQFQIDGAQIFCLADIHAYMMSTCQVLSEKQKLVPAITHVDGSARPQSVHSHINPRFHQLISAFAALTDVPMLVNTSFNENEPIVCTPDEAVACFLRTDIDILVMHRHVIARDLSALESDALPRAARANLPTRHERHQTSIVTADNHDKDSA